MKTDEKKLIRQGEIPIGYWEGETIFLDSEFLGCGIGRGLSAGGGPSAGSPASPGSWTGNPHRRKSEGCGCTN